MLRSALPLPLMLAGVVAVTAATTPSHAAAPARRVESETTKTSAKTAKKPGARTRLVVAGEGNEARYRVREQLAGFDLPNDAVGVTHDVTGAMLFDADGNLICDSSKIVVTLTGLKSDKSMRDNYVRRRALVTDSFPAVAIAPTALKGLSGKLPTSGSKTFELVGDLTVRSVTHPTTWTVTAKFDKGEVTGTAATAFTFKDFDLTQPHVPVVLSVADTIKLEYDFHLVPDTTKR